MTILQELLFPRPDLCGETGMYFRPDGAQITTDAARLEKGGSLSADTFFNAFSIGKWRRYTRLDNLALRLEMEGAFRVRLVHCRMDGDGLQRKTLSERFCRAGRREVVELAFPDALAEDGLYTFELIAEEAGVLCGGGYCTKAEDGALEPVKIAVDICTYRREEQVRRNLELLKHSILDAPDCPLRGHLDVYVSDNGQTLDVEPLQSEHIHIYKNKNTGGAGGFARGMIEILDSGKPYTHVLVMDDDVSFSVDALLRSYRLLQLLKPEHAGKTVAGALMRLDERNVQYENGAIWDGLEPRPCKSNLDMCRLENVLENERGERVDYNGWWYSCVPMSKIRGDNLPLPLFVHRDDVEFALRTGSDILSLNGICVWHESFDNRYSSAMVYYETRNDLILNALHRPGFNGSAAAKLMIRKLIVNVIRYRYNDCERVLRGADDFCKGADFLKQADPEALNRAVMENAYRFRPLDQLEIPFDEARYLASLEKGKTRRVMLRVMLLNGLFLPAKGPNVVNAATCWPRCCYRRSALLNYDPITERGFITRRSFVKSMSMVFRMIACAFRLLRRTQTAAAGYRAARVEMTSREFWDRYLNLK